MVVAKCGYQNVGRGSAAALTFLNYSAEERWDVCWVAEPCITSSPTGWGTQSQPGFRRLLPTALTGRHSHGVIMYIRESGPLAKATPFGDGIHWAGLHTKSSAYVGIYMSPSLTAPEYRAIMSQLKEALQSFRHITIMGDFNCLHEVWSTPVFADSDNNRRAIHERRLAGDRPRARAILQLAEDLQLHLRTPPGMPTRRAVRDLVLQESTIDLIWTTGSWIPTQRELVSLSDHVVLAGTTSTTDTLSGSREATALDWSRVEKWIKVQNGEVEADDTFRMEDPPTSGAEAYNRLRSLVAKDWARPVCFHPRSKPYWDQELSAARDQVTTASWPQWKAARKRFRRLLQQKRRRHWEEYLEEHGAEDPWQVVKVARDPFKLKASMPQELSGGDGAIFRTNAEKCEAIIRHNFQPPHYEESLREELFYEKLEYYSSLSSEESLRRKVH